MRKQLLITLSFSIMLSSCTFVSDDKSEFSSDTDNESSVISVDKTEAKTIDLFAMDTYMTLSAYGENAENALNKAKERINQLDSLLSTGNKNSEIYSLNLNGKGSLSEDTSEVFKSALDISEQTKGAFNPVVYPLMEAWGFADKNFRIPDNETISKLLTLTDTNNIDFNNNDVSFQKEGMKVDFGGIAKGYTSSKIMDIFKESGVESGMICLGGNVQVLGTKPDGSLWRVAIQNPDSETEYLGILQISDKAVITSGSYERYFEQNGKRYHHILDPKTGYPSESGLKSVTIISNDGTLADGLSTALFVMGLDKALSFWKLHSDEFDVIFYSEENELYITDGVKDYFSSDLDYEVIEKESL
ncbi:MAG: FAD:protein FMN transferase [Ruminococcus sp.]|nr:FAD:protein FMN transferase [Ruminococcus sp.]